MLSPSRRSGSGIVQLVNKGETSPVLLINPVFTITANDFTSACANAAARRYPKVRQKSKSSGASPQKYPNPQQFHEDFINIITSTDSIDYPDNFVDYYEDHSYLGIIGGGGGNSANGGHSSRSSGANSASGRSFHSNPYINSGYGSNSKLLQVPSSSAIILPCSGRDDDLSPTRNSRQQRSSSITVPIQHQKSPERCSSEVFIRRCSSASPKGRYYQYQLQQQQKLIQQQKQQKQKQRKFAELSPKRRGGFQRERGFSLTNTTANLPQQLLTATEWNGQNKSKRRRSSGYRRPSNHSMLTAFSSSSSSLSSPSNSPNKQRLTSPFNRQRTHSMPSTISVPNGGLVSRRNSQKCGSDPVGSDDKDNTSESIKPKSKGSKASYDVVIIGSPNVGKSTLAEYFNKAGGTSGSDQGIGSEEDESDDYEDEDLSSGKAILFRPTSELNQQVQYNFSLRIFCQQISAVNHLYKYDGVIILYSVTDRDSFEFARKALDEIVPVRKTSVSNRGANNNSSTEVEGKAKKVVILVGNKSDLERSRSVTALEGRSLATAYDCKFIEISSSLDVGIESLQKGLAAQVYLRHHKALEANGHLGHKAQLTSSSSNSSANSSSLLLAQQKQRKRKTSAALSSLKLAQKLIDKIMSIRVSHGKSKSCLDLHSL